MLWSILIAVLLVLLVWGFSYLKKRQDQMEVDFNRRFFGKTVHLLDKAALYIAQQSDGYSHTRGVGYLVLSDEELYFERRVAKKVVAIPVERLLGASRCKRLAGQSTLRPMLKIEFTDAAGNRDAIALQVKAFERWIEAINQLSGV